MKLKNIIAGVCSFALIAVPVLSTSIDVYAGGADYHYFSNAGSATEGSMEVGVDVTNTWLIKLPAFVGLLPNGSYGDARYAAYYTISVYAIISDSKKLVVQPTNSEFTMTGANTSTTATGTITQEKTNFMNIIDNDLTDVALVEYSEGVKEGFTSGTVSVNFNTVDTYSGNIGFSFGLQDKY